MYKCIRKNIKNNLTNNCQNNLKINLYDKMTKYFILSNKNIKTIIYQKLNIKILLLFFNNIYSIF